MGGPLSKYGTIYGHMGHRVSTRGGVFSRKKSTKIVRRPGRQEKRWEIAEFYPFRDILNVLELIWAILKHSEAFWGVFEAFLCGFCVDPSFRSAELASYLCAAYIVNWAAKKIFRRFQREICRKVCGEEKFSAFLIRNHRFRVAKKKNWGVLLTDSLGKFYRSAMNLPKESVSSTP